MSAHGRCCDDDDDVRAGYCSSGPHVRSQMRPKNAKNEAGFPPFYIMYVCQCVRVIHRLLWKIMGGPCLRPGCYKVREG